MRVLGTTVISGVVALAAASSASTSFPRQVGRIAFDRPQDSNVEVYSMKDDGSDVRNLSNSTPGDHDPRYSRDGSRIVFVSKRDGTPRSTP
jgi:TolB protein